MVKVFNYFHMPTLINLQKAAGQNWMSKIPSFCYCNHKVNASKFSILISTNSEIKTYQKRMIKALPISGSFFICPGNCYI